MSARTNILLLYAAIESSPGVDVIDGDLSGRKPLFALNPVVYAAEADEIQRMVTDGQTMPLASLLKLQRGRISFTCELRGNGVDGAPDDEAFGTAGNEPETHPLLLACDLQVNYTPESDEGYRDGYISYTPAPFLPDQGTTLTIYYFYAGKLHVLTGCKGKVTFNAAVGDFIRANFEFQGGYNAITDASIPTVTNADFSLIVPPVWGIGNSSAFTINSATACISAFQCAVDNSLAMRHCPNAAKGFYGFIVSDRKITGTMDPEDLTEASRPDWENWNSQNPLGISCIAGTTVGNRVEVYLAAQIRTLTYGDRSGLVIKQATLSAMRLTPGTPDSDTFYLKFS